MMPKITIPPEEDQALRRIAPAYLKRPVQRVRWAIAQLLAAQPGRSRNRRKNAGKDVLPRILEVPAKQAG